MSFWGRKKRAIHVVRLVPSLVCVRLVVKFLFTQVRHTLDEYGVCVLWGEEMHRPAVCEGNTPSAILSISFYPVRHLLLLEPSI